MVINILNVLDKINKGSAHNGKRLNSFENTGVRMVVLCFLCKDQQTSNKSKTMEIVHLISTIFILEYLQNILFVINFLIIP